MFQLEVYDIEETMVEKMINIFRKLKKRFLH
jgi:predicted nucleotidyltransferase component of viral defense system